MGDVYLQFELLLSDFLVRFRTTFFFFSILLAFLCPKFSRFICMRHHLFSCHHYVYLKRQVVGTSLFVQPLHVHNSGVQALLCAEGSAPLQKLSAQWECLRHWCPVEPPIWYSESQRDVAQMVLVLIYVSQENQVGTFNWTIVFF